MKYFKCFHGYNFSIFVFRTNNTGILKFINVLNFMYVVRLYVFSCAPIDCQIPSWNFFHGKDISPSIWVLSFYPFLWQLCISEQSCIHFFHVSFSVACSKIWYRFVLITGGGKSQFSLLAILTLLSNKFSSRLMHFV